MSLKWPGDRTKIVSLRGSRPATILAQLMEVVDQLESVTVTVQDKEGHLQTFSSAMPLSDLAFHAWVHNEDISATIRGDEGADVPEDEAG